MDFIFSRNSASGARVRDAGAPSVDIPLNSSFCIREEEITYADRYREKKEGENGAFAIAASIDEYTKTFAPKSTSSSSSLHNVRNKIT
jgi:hypothetical protein